VDLGTGPGSLLRLRPAVALYDVPALERSHAALWAWSCLLGGALIVPEITSIVRRPLTGRRRGSR
jgi:hypothetical protein